MKNVFRFLAVVVMLISIVTAVGCSSASNPAGSAKDRAVSMMQVLASNVSDFSYLDIYMMRTDKNLSSEWTSLSNQSSEDSVLKTVNGLGVVYTESIGLVVGDLSLDQLVGNKSTGSYEYEGFKVKTYPDTLSAVMVNGVSITSLDDQIKGCIDVASGKEASLYSNEDLKAVVDRLPVGYALAILVVGNVSAPEGFSGLLATGISTAKQGGSDVQTQVCKFNGSDAAQQYVALASNKSSDATTHIDRTQDGAFVTEVITYLTPTPTPESTSTPVATVTPTPAP